MTELSLYERLGGIFAIAAVVDHFSDAVVQNPIVGQQSENPACGSGTRTISADCRASSSCAPRGYAMFRAGPSSMQRPDQGARPSGWKRPIAHFGSLQMSSTRSRPNLVALLTSSRCPEREKDEVLGAFAAHKTEVTD